MVLSKKYKKLKYLFCVVILLLDNTKDGNPTFANILVKPEVTVINDVEINSELRKAVLKVKGLLCSG